MEKGMVDIVDEDDKVVGATSELDSTFNSDIITRAISILIFNNKGELLLVKRSKNKWRYPLHFCSSVGGMADKGEDYVTCALRELEEELGIKKFPEDLKFLFKKIIQTDKKEMVSVFSLNFEGPLSPNPDEVDSSIWITPKNVFKLRENGEKVTDYILKILKEAEQRGFL